jgi:3D domain-containing protein
MSGLTSGCARAARRTTVTTIVLSIAIAAAAGAGGPGALAASPGSGRCPPVPPHAVVHRIKTPRWLTRTLVTEYFPIRESWFQGRPVLAPGLKRRHRVDWLYGPQGVAMNGEGIGLDGRVYHFAGPYDLSWVNVRGTPTLPCWNGHWTRGFPAWYGTGWRNAHGEVTFPLAAGNWSNGPPVRLGHSTRPPRFAPGPSLPLAYWKRAAVDPQLIPLGSRLFIPVYCRTPAHGWFTAGDVGGAIIARHVDVFRAPPASLADTRAHWNQTIFVVPPGTTPLHQPHC